MNGINYDRERLRRRRTVAVYPPRADRVTAERPCRMCPERIMPGQLAYRLPDGFIHATHDEAVVSSPAVAPRGATAARQGKRTARRDA